MSERNQHDLRIVAAVGRELERVRAQEDGRSAPRLAAVGRRSTVMAALAAALLTATAAAAATGALELGDVIPGGAPTGESERADETLIAAGATPVAGPWRMTTYVSKKAVDDNGEVMEEAGQPCLRLMLTAAVTPMSGSGWCGEPNDDFVVAGLPVALKDGRSEVIFFGVAPETAAVVQLTAADGKTIDVPTLKPHASAPGKPWVMAAPLGLSHAEIAWVDDAGHPRGRPREVSSVFARAASLTRAVALSRNRGTD